MAQLLKEFVTARVVNFNGIDLERFRFDYDLTFTILFMDAEGRTYSRFGTRDARSAIERMSLRGLKKAMREVLAIHRKARPASGAALPPGKPRTLHDIPAFEKSKAARGGCYHCHYANNFRFRELSAQGKFRKDMLFLHPLPENIGVTLEVDSNNVVKSVVPGSPAGKAGLRPGDEIAQAESTPVLTSADLQFALDPLPEEARLTLQVNRAGAPLPPLVLDLPRGWRKTDISWRASQEAASPSVGIWAEALDEAQKKRRGIAGDRMALRVTFLFPGEGWAPTRGELKLGDVIVGLDGEALPSMNVRQFHSRFRLAHQVGDTATLTVLRGKERLELRVPCLEQGQE